jgi:hypothetical protein
LVGTLCILGVSTLFFYTMENNITEEIILQPDGKFYKRKSVTSYLMSQEEAIQKVKAKPIYQVCPMPLGEEASTFFSSYAGDNSSAFYLTTEIGQYPFPGAHLHPEEDQDGNRKYLLLMDRDINNLPEAAIPNSELEHVPAYQPNTNERLFITIRYTYDDRDINTDEPMLFLYDGVSEKSYALNLPNIFDGGRICTGNAWPRHITGYVRNALGLHNAQINDIMTSFANNDLRNKPLEFKHLHFNTVGKHLNPVPPSEGNKHFFQEITNEQILLFTTWLNDGSAI